ncbi:Erv46p [Sugiyamaella lignohabitans]|uniref:Endoplasmic reticulum-Golgi intermediate compartment protein n=1 Tax=Sugiyamaella lignohabitans TaxID=796027 RepID=A0A167FRI1_9ASCO|nr:Erv46p [Sugiyamaella lignohabitans]ANB15609.1 Erv46p [Sugiyamaella lignohabitans]
MPPKKLLSFDAFSKTVEDARIRTASGGIVTIVSIVLIVWLTLWEWVDYRRIDFAPELIVDKARGERLDIYLNVTFPHMPCELVTMDAMDASGEIQAEIEHNVLKTRLDPKGNRISSSQLLLESEQESNAINQRLKDPNYCGSCYGSKPDGECCNTCAEIKQAYAAKGWAFDDGSGMEQCEEEHYQEKIQATRDEGCNIAGKVSVNKVLGNLHFAPGSSLTQSMQHTHDLTLFMKPEMPFTFSHIIHHLSFGPPVEGTNGVNDRRHSPLDGTVHETEVKKYSYRYFIKVVATRFEWIDGQVTETNEYSVTSHERSHDGGRDEDHPNTLHSRGGIPGVFFDYDISPMKVINRERRPKSFGSFLTGVCAIVGGVLTLGAVIDRGVWEADKALRRKKTI